MDTKTIIYVPKKRMDVAGFIAHLTRCLQDGFKDRFLNKINIRSPHDVKKKGEKYDHHLLDFTVGMKFDEQLSGEMRITLDIFSYYDQVMAKDFFIVKMDKSEYSIEISSFVVYRFGGFVDLDTSDNVFINLSQSDHNVIV